MLAQLRIMPKADDPGRNIFEYAHYQDHLGIVQSINSKQGITLPMRAIFPMPRDEPGRQTWLQMHQRLHDDMMQTLKLSRFDLTVLLDQDDNARNDWAWRNWGDHLAAHRALKLP